MITRRTARVMLWTGVALIIAGSACNVLVSNLLRPNVNTSPVLDVVITLNSVLSLATLSGCGFIALAVVAYALSGRRIALSPRRSSATPILWIGIVALVTGIGSTWVNQAIQAALTQSQIARDVFSILGFVILPLLGNVIPTLGALLVPASVMLRALDHSRPAPEAQRVFRGSRPAPQPTSPDGE